MSKKTIQFLLLTLYTVISAAALTYFQANIIPVLLVLSVIPAIIFWRLEKLRSFILIFIILLSLGLTVLLEALAYLNGIWYETSPSEWRVFGFIPVEAFIAAFVHLIYFIVVYEYFFDDKQSGGRAVKFWPVISVISALSLCLGMSYIYIFSSLILTYAFVWLLSGLLIISVASIYLLPAPTKPLLRKLIFFPLALLPISLSYEYAALSSNLRFFANTPDYLFIFTALGQTVPLEELIFILLVPFVVVLFYELTLDDGH